MFHILQIEQDGKKFCVLAPNDETRDIFAVNMRGNVDSVLSMPISDETALRSVRQQLVDAVADTWEDRILSSEQITFSIGAFSKIEEMLIDQGRSVASRACLPYNEQVNPLDSKSENALMSALRRVFFDYLIHNHGLDRDKAERLLLPR